MNMQDIRNEVVDYIRNSGEDIEDYDVDVIADYLYDAWYCGGEGVYRVCFEPTVFENRITE